MKQPNRILRFTFYIFLLLVLSALAAPVVAQSQTVTDDEVNDVAEELYCPVCENTPLDVCATQACADWREVIRTKLSEGESKQEILNYFARQYGDGVLAEPPRRGLSLMLWLFPIVAVLLGGVFFTRYLRDLRQTADREPTASGASPPPTAVSPSDSTASEDYLARIEKELQEE